MSRLLKGLLRRLSSGPNSLDPADPSAEGLISQLKRQLAAWQLGWPPGHFYSPLPDLDQVRRREADIFGPPPAALPGIALNEADQLRLLEALHAFYDQMPFGDAKQPGLRFFFDNPNFSYGEAIVLYCMVSHFRPKRVIEVGSGYSSCALLDTNELVCGNSIACTFVEPYPDLFLSLLKPEDLARIELIQKPLQEVSLELFSELRSGDFLIIDSSHVSKVDSDVNRTVFEILPRLAAGVHIHFHDIAYPFEYPKEWVYQGRAWNEAYLLRGFLQYNSAFSVELFNSYLGQFHREALGLALPLCLRNPGTSLWLRKNSSAWSESHGVLG